MNERVELARMSDRELAAYFNVLTAGMRVVARVDPENKTARHLGIVTELLRERRIAFTPGRRIAA